MHELKVVLGLTLSAGQKPLRVKCGPLRPSSYLCIFGHIYRSGFFLRLWNKSLM